MDYGTLSNKQPDHESKRLRWKPSHDKVLVKLLIKVIGLTNTPIDGFDATTWFHVRDEFNASTRLDVDMNQLSSKVIVLRSRYENITTRSLEKERRRIEGLPVRAERKPRKCCIYDQLCAIFKRPETANTKPDQTMIDNAGPSALARSNASELSVNDSFSFTDCAKALDEIDHDENDEHVLEVSNMHPFSFTDCVKALDEIDHDDKCGVVI